MSALTVGRFRFAPILTAVVITVLLIMLFGHAAELFILLFIAILISLYLGAVADWLRDRAHLSRGVSLAIAVVSTIAAVVALFWVLVPPVIDQTQALIRVLPDYIQNWERGLERLASRFPALQGAVGEGTLLRAVYERITGAFGDVVPKVYGVLHGAINVFAVAIMSLYLALHPGLYREWMIAMFPPIHRDLVRDVLGDLANTLRSWIVGQLLAMTILGVFTAAGLYLLEVPYWLTFGVFTGVVAVVPFFGSLVSTVLPALFVIAGNGIWGLSGFTHALLVAALGVVIHVIEANVVLPRIMQKQIDLPPVLTIMAVLIMGKLLGPVGLIVAVPTLAVIMVVVRRILISRIYEGQGFRRTTRDSVVVLRVPAVKGGVLVPPPPGVDPLTLAEARRERVA
ncbi:MAG TPA: AI-2E family transporter [Gemmatimonadaceae bacterium]|nr:AI-2E family transporter [Gemmatimonadaceae bacterium]